MNTKAEAAKKMVLAALNGKKFPSRMAPAVESIKTAIEGLDETKSVEVYEWLKADGWDWIAKGESGSSSRLSAVLDHAAVGKSYLAGRTGLADARDVFAQSLSALLLA